MDFATIAAYLLGQADQQHDTAVRAYENGDHSAADRHAQTRQVYDDAAARLLALTPTR